MCFTWEPQSNSSCSKQKQNTRISKLFCRCFLVAPPGFGVQGNQQSSSFVSAPSGSRKWPQSSPLSAAFQTSSHPGKTFEDQSFSPPPPSCRLLYVYGSQSRIAQWGFKYSLLIVNVFTATCSTRGWSQSFRALCQQRPDVFFKVIWTNKP